MRIDVHPLLAGRGKTNYRRRTGGRSEPVLHFLASETQFLFVFPRDLGQLRTVPLRRSENIREIVERETGIEPATNGLGSRYSTIELLPLC